MSSTPLAPATLHRRGVLLERTTLTWNVAGVVVLAVSAATASSVALVGFGIDSLIEIGASAVVLWELADPGDTRRPRALRLIGWAFAALAAYLAVQSTVALAARHHARLSTPGVTWTAATAVVMFVLAAGKTRVGRALDDPVLLTEGQVTRLDAILALAVVTGLTLDAALGWWWTDPVAGLVIVVYAAREAHQLLVEES